MSRRSTFGLGELLAVASMTACVTCVMACGGKTVSGDDDASPTTDSGSVTTDTSVPPLDGFGPDTTPPPFDGPVPTDVAPEPDVPTPVDVVGHDTAPPDPSICDQLASAICTSSTAACCTSRGTKYDESTCKTEETTFCNQQIALVKSGKLTYDPTQLSACKSAWTSEFGKCSIFYIDWVKMNAPCGQLFNGTVAPGGACTYDYQCQNPVGGSAYCNPTSHKCNSYVVVGAGAGCNYAGTKINYCDDGYYCDLTSTTPTCQPQKALGAACDGPDDTSCGYDNVCNASGVCAAGAAAGTACTNNNECASWYCDPSTKKCSDGNVELGDTSSGICTP